MKLRVLKNDRAQMVAWVPRTIVGHCTIALRISLRILRRSTTKITYYSLQSPNIRGEWVGALLSPYYRPAIALLSPFYCAIIALLSRYYRPIVALLSPYCRAIIALLLCYYRHESSCRISDDWAARTSTTRDLFFMAIQKSQEIDFLWP